MTASRTPKLTASTTVASVHPAASCKVTGRFRRGPRHQVRTEQRHKGGDERRPAPDGDLKRCHGYPMALTGLSSWPSPAHVVAYRLERPSRRHGRPAGPGTFKVPGPGAARPAGMSSAPVDCPRQLVAVGHGGGSSWRATVMVTSAGCRDWPFRAHTQLLLADGNSLRDSPAKSCPGILPTSGRCQRRIGRSGPCRAWARRAWLEGGAWSDSPAAGRTWLRSPRREREAGGVPPGLLGDCLPAVDAFGSGRRLSAAELAGYGRSGEQAAEAGSPWAAWSTSTVGDLAAVARTARRRLLTHGAAGLPCWPC